MDPIVPSPVGVLVIISFLLIGLVVMGCMLYWNWSHRKQRSAEASDAFSNANPCIYEKTNQRGYMRSSNGQIWQIFTYSFLPSINTHYIFPSFFLIAIFRIDKYCPLLLRHLIDIIFLFSLSLFCFSLFFPALHFLFWEFVASLIITAATHPYTGSDAENGSIVQKQWEYSLDLDHTKAKLWEI